MAERLRVVQFLATDYYNVVQLLLRVVPSPPKVEELEQEEELPPLVIKLL